MEKNFSPIRNLIWPIYKSEIKKFLPMAGIIFCILFNYTLLRNMKDTLVVNSAGAGAINFLKLYCVTPSAILFVTIYMKLTGVLSKENIFYAMLTPFLVFFLAFGFLIYPNIDSIHPSIQTVQALYAKYPSLTGFIDIYAYWGYSLFYILAEIWGSVGVSLLFWQFANQITAMNQSKRFYPLFISIGNLALIACGALAIFLDKGINNLVPAGMDKWTFCLGIQMSLVFLAGLAGMGLYRFLHVKVIPFEEAVEKKEKKSKTKTGLIEGVKTVFSSKHLGFIAALVMAYGVSINLVEVQWKNQVKLNYSGNKNAFNAFMNSYSMWTGIVAIGFSWFAASGILKKLTWFTSAIITPAIVLLGGAVLFAALFLKETFTSLSMNPVLIATLVGAGVVAVSKTVKYALFDTTKEMAYIPLSDDLKSKGKAAVDVVGGRLGKAGGAFVQSGLMILMGTTNVLIIAPYSVVIFIIVCLLWVVAVKGLNKEMLSCLSAKNEKK